ncbi:glycosyltransferase family 4 protein [Patescibacteria group bacterium]
MKAAIYNPYWDSMGGGERYTLTFARVLVGLGYLVEIEWDGKDIIKKLSDRFGINLQNVRFVKSVNKGEGYDLCFWISDGSIPLMKARQNILHFQFPFRDVRGKSLMNKMKLHRINHVVSNSKFTKNIVDQEYGIDSIVIYPPVDTKMFKPQMKENIILYVGRFSQLAQSKNQHVLIDVFKKYYDEGGKGWKLVLAGGSGVGTGDYVKKLQNSAKTYPIRILKNPNLKKLKEMYGKSKIFWSAVGFGSDERKNPEKFEHFGISLVEAMSAKCVPIVFAGGGYREIINRDSNGYFWEKKLELINQTKLLNKDDRKLRSIARISKVDSEKYSDQKFEKRVKEMLP